MGRRCHRKKWWAAMGTLLMLAGWLLIAAATGADVAKEENKPAAKRALFGKGALRGMTISCRGDGVAWGSDAMLTSMQSVQKLGANWIAIHPYAGIRKDGQVYLWRRLKLDEPPVWLTRPIAEAHRMGLKIMIKPHIGYWGSGFSWRGAIEFQEEEHWQRFFADYRRWVVRLASICREADAFVVGTELDRTIHRVDEWRRIIREVRKHYDGPLTYAANWSEYQRVQFWDDLDAVGIQAYFPILEESPGKQHGAAPEEQELRKGWQRIARDLRNYSRKVGKKTILTELGYNRSALAPYQPWDYRVGGDQAEQIQIRCLTAALKVIDQEESIQGVFLWKWFPGDRPPRNFSMSAPAMRQVITEQWSEPDKK
ncbi:MAG: hypothetical protein V3T77_07005 [Planctomycetota bacterium]